MIYAVINFGVAVYLVRLALNINIKTLNNNAENSLVNTVLLAAAIAGLSAIVDILILYGPASLTIVLEYAILLMITLLFLMVSFFFVFCAFGKNKFLLLIEFFLVVFAAYIIIGRVTITDYKTLAIASDKVIESFTEFPYNKFSWLQLHVMIYLLGLPTFSLLLLMLYAENSNSRLLFQNAFMYFGIMVFGLIGSIIIVALSSKITMFITLYSLVICVMITMFVHVSTQDKILDRFSMWSNFLFKLIKYALPAIIGAFLFVKLRPLYEKSPAIYFGIMFAVILLAALISYSLVKLVARLSTFRSAQYGTDFEADLAAIDYNDETADICEKFYSIFQKHVNVDKMKIFIAGGNEELNTVFSSDGNKVTLSTVDPGLEIIRSEGLNIFMEDDIQTHYMLQQKKSDIDAFMKAVSAETLIILNEGRHLIGVIALGKKRGGSSYDEYDKEVFDKLYSYFFVFGYYMSNIANASVVGTVNREIKMSAQIIKSIQENMDFLNNPKIDVGYLMVPAHNIGGEFVDLIRLSETRHIFVVGAMSGKGISASMSMVILKSIIRTLLTTTHDFKKLVAKVNSFIRTGLPKGTFFAGVFCMVDFETDTLYYINCGIPTMLLYTRSFNNVIEIQGNGFVLGFAKDITPLLKVKQMKLNPGDVMAITTAGIITSHSLRGDQYGKDSIKKSMTDNYMYDGMHMAEFLFDDLKRFMAKELDEDITVMMIRYLDKDTQTVSNLDDEDEVKQPAVEEEKKSSGPIVLEAL